MASYLMIVYSAPVKGREDEYNRWYNEQHLPDVLRVDGVAAARRFNALPAPDGEKAGYMAIYELECDDPTQVMDRLAGLAGTDEMVMTDAMDPDSVSVVFYDAITRRVVAK